MDDSFVIFIVSLFLSLSILFLHNRVAILEKQVEELQKSNYLEFIENE